jgi:hypothetical protein
MAITAETIPKANNIILPIQACFFSDCGMEHRLITRRNVTSIAPPATNCTADRLGLLVPE